MGTLIIFFRHCLSVVFSSFLSFLTVSFILPSVKADAAANSAQSSGSSYEAEGYISLKYISRSVDFGNESADDQDMATELRLDVTRPADNRYELHLFGTAKSDLDGNTDKSDYYPLEDIGDARSNDTYGYLYEAHIDINRIAGLSQVRLGRQTGAREEPVFFDGIAADIDLTRAMSFTLYGGAAVHFNELNAGSDTLAGAGLDVQPGSSTSVSLDYLSVDDKRDLFYSDKDQKNTLASIKLSHRFAPVLKTMVKLRYIDGEARDVKVRAVNAYQDYGLEIALNYFRQMEIQNELSNEFSAFYDVLGRSYPYHSYDIKARKFFGSHTALDLGYFQRSLIKGYEESALNREFKRTFANFELFDVMKNGLSFAVSMDRWEAGDDREFSSSGMEAGYSFKKGGRNGRISTGSSFSLYKYDYYIELGEREKVRTYYLNAKLPLGRKLLVNAGYELDASVDDYNTMKLGLRYDF